jgi:hypothetical protein
MNGLSPLSNCFPLSGRATRKVSRSNGLSIRGHDRPPNLAASRPFEPAAAPVPDSRRVQI